jgi:hypothetical protein
MLAKKGLLAFALESEMSKPVASPLASTLAPGALLILVLNRTQIMIGKGFEVETVKRNLDATGGFHVNRMSKDLTGSTIILLASSLYLLRQRALTSDTLSSDSRWSGLEQVFVLIPFGPSSP